ncbi:hypothetical protein [uncultured Pseudoflavonifractor sp.]|uniref:hypothetical protein n=1 Tax=uncultured Pseudoflavonifractor sp. TaxID=1221379 RepID=UPI0025E711C1|nr:hypothetical protein [uncultured Pseudoflavonifractor sp.]
MKNTGKKEKEAVQPEKYLWCAKMTDSRDYIINPEARHELPCCCEACFDQVKAFVERDKRFRMPFYLALAVLVVANLFFFGLLPDVRWRYLPMLGIGVLAAVFPYVFASYERYQAIGLRRTTVIVRVLASAVAVFAAVLIVVG